MIGRTQCHRWCTIQLYLELAASGNGLGKSFISVLGPKSGVPHMVRICLIRQIGSGSFHDLIRVHQKFVIVWICFPKCKRRCNSGKIRWQANSSSEVIVALLCMILQWSILASLIITANVLWEPARCQFSTDQQEQPDTKIQKWQNDKLTMKRWSRTTTLVWWRQVKLRVGTITKIFCLQFKMKLTCFVLSIWIR